MLSSHDLETVQSEIRQVHEDWHHKQHHLVSSEYQYLFNMELCRRLRHKKWGVVVAEKMKTNMGFRNLYHTFLVLHTADKKKYVIDPFFREQFEIYVPSTERYQTIYSALPSTFLGTHETLTEIVKRLSREIQRLFQESRRDLPPWRSHEALLSKWDV